MELFWSLEMTKKIICEINPLIVDYVMMAWLRGNSKRHGKLNNHLSHNGMTMTPLVGVNLAHYFLLFFLNPK